MLLASETGLFVCLSFRSKSVYCMGAGENEPALFMEDRTRVSGRNIALVPSPLQLTKLIVYPSIKLTVCLSHRVCPSNFLTACLHACLCLPPSLSACLTASLPACLPVHLCLSVCLSVCAQHLPKGATRGQLMENTTMTENTMIIQAYCWPYANSLTASCVKDV